MSKIKVAAVTGYIPIIGHPRTVEEYGRFGEGLKALRHTVLPYYHQNPRQTWLAEVIERFPEKVSWAKGDNPAKNSLEYHAVQHQKIEWVRRAAAEHPDFDAYVWIDYGILRLPGVSPGMIDECLDRVVKNDLAIPGCWERMDPRVEQTIDSEYSPCWRFCGSMFIVPKYIAEDLAKVFKAVTRTRLRAMRKVLWEVNTLASVEAVTRLPIHWYKADHNAYLFENYRK